MKKLIFIVEDDNYIRNDLIELLQMEDFEVRAFVNGRDVLVDLKERVHLPKLLILDLMMPIMNGYEVLEELSKEVRFQELPVLVVSADRQALSLPKAPTLGFITKPIDLEDFLKSVEQFSR